jgi:hypothetical protein
MRKQTYDSDDTQYRIPAESDWCLDTARGHAIMKNTSLNSMGGLPRVVGCAFTPFVFR